MNSWRKKGRSATAYRVAAAEVQLDSDAEILADWFHDVIGAPKFSNRKEFVLSLESGVALIDIMNKLFADEVGSICGRAPFQRISSFRSACMKLGFANESVFSVSDVIREFNAKSVFATLLMLKQKSEKRSEQKAEKRSEQKVEADDEDDPWLTCDVCCEKYDDTRRAPRLLLCGHTFCQECLDALNVGSVIKCPNKDGDTKVGKDGVNGLKRNYALLSQITSKSEFVHKSKENANLKLQVEHMTNQVSELKITQDKLQEELKVNALQKLEILETMQLQAVIMKAAARMHQQEKTIHTREILEMIQLQTLIRESADETRLHQDRIVKKLKSQYDLKFLKMENKYIEAAQTHFKTEKDLKDAYYAAMNSQVDALFLKNQQLQAAHTKQVAEIRTHQDRIMKELESQYILKGLELENKFTEIAETYVEAQNDSNEDYHAAMNSHITKLESQVDALVLKNQQLQAAHTKHLAEIRTHQDRLMSDKSKENESLKRQLEHMKNQTTEQKSAQDILSQTMKLESQEYWRDRLEVGQAIDCSDGSVWFPAVILDIDVMKRMVRVHFDGFHTKYDRSIEIDSDLIAPKHTKTGTA